MTEYGAPERKFQQAEAGLVVTEGHVVEGYASLFGKTDQGGDIVQKLSLIHISEPTRPY